MKQAHDICIEMARGADRTANPPRGLAVVHSFRHAASPGGPVPRSPSAIPRDMTKPRAPVDFADPGFCREERNARAIVARRERTRRWQDNAREPCRSVTNPAELDGRRVSANHFITG